MLASRRGFLKSLFVAPAIVAVTNIMPVKALDWLTQEQYPINGIFRWGPNSGNTTIRFLEDSKSLWTERWTEHVFVEQYKDINEVMYANYKGKSSFDAGMFYCPYVPLQSARAVEEDWYSGSIKPQFKTRYGIIYDGQGVSPLTEPSAEVFEMRRKYIESKK